MTTRPTPPHSGSVGDAPELSHAGLKRAALILRFIGNSNPNLGFLCDKGLSEWLVKDIVAAYKSYESDAAHWKGKKRTKKANTTPPHPGSAAELIEQIRARLTYIVDREDYTFAECSEAEAIVENARDSLRFLSLLEAMLAERDSLLKKWALAFRSIASGHGDMGKSLREEDKEQIARNALREGGLL